MVSPVQLDVSISKSCAIPPLPANAPKFKGSQNAITTLEKRYLKKDEAGNIIETPEELFWRVAYTVALAEKKYGANDDEVMLEALHCYNLMVNQIFMPNTPTLLNAGLNHGSFAACFVLPVEDSIQGIMKAVDAVGRIQKCGGGTGFSLDRLRPTGDLIKSTTGETSGPLSFWRIFDATTNAITQGSKRRGANMMMFKIRHPDILKFIVSKENKTDFTSFNISVKPDEEFMHDVVSKNWNKPFFVRNDRTGKEYLIPKTIDIRNYRIQDLIATSNRTTNTQEVYTVADVWKLILNQAHLTGDPGLYFIDRVNKLDPGAAKGLYKIESSNPCGEQALEPWGQCTLGSINISKFVENGSFDFAIFRNAVRDTTRFLDNVLDVTGYPLPEVEETANKNRRTGLGIMGFADALFELNIKYDSEEALAFAEKLALELSNTSSEESELLAEQRGVPANVAAAGLKRRNMMTTTIAPTGTISIIADCSGGIEPIFSLAFERNVLNGTKMLEVNRSFVNTIKHLKLSDQKSVIDEALSSGTIQQNSILSSRTKDVFVTARDISPEWHIKMQAAWQKHIHNSISKTVNLPHEATIEDIERAYILAYQLGCKGITVYRDRCRENQPMALKNEKRDIAKEIIDGVKALSDKPIFIGDVEEAKRLRQVTPFGNMHVHITFREGKPIEVFAQLGKGGDVANSDLEAICRVLSLYLRCGGNIELAIRQLEGIGSNFTIPSKNGSVLSLGDGLAKALRKIYKSDNVKPTNGTNNYYDLKCQDCGGTLFREEGCMTCKGCGWSKCS